MKEIEATIKGKVQLVMFRDFIQRKARVLGIVGFVRNNNDGTVTVFAQGEDNKLKEFVEHLKKGSILSSVESVSVEWREPRKHFTNFSILYI